MNGFHAALKSKTKDDNNGIITENLAKIFKDCNNHIIFWYIYVAKNLYYWPKNWQCQYLGYRGILNFII